jgi:hypothetical protein
MARQGDHVVLIDVLPAAREAAQTLKERGYSVAALRVAHGPRLRAWGQRASKGGNSGRLKGRIVIESGESLSETA